MLKSIETPTDLQLFYCAERIHMTYWWLKGACELVLVTGGSSGSLDVYLLQAQ